MLQQIFQGCLQIDLMFLLTQNLENAAKISIAERSSFAHRLQSDVSIEENTCLCIRERGKYWINCPRRCPTLPSRRVEQGRNLAASGGVSSSFNELWFLVWWEVWVRTCNALITLQPGLQCVEKSLTT